MKTCISITIRFLSVFLICAVIFISVIALIKADLTSRKISGNMEKNILSYEKVSQVEGKFEAFGIVYKIDLELLEKIKDKAVDTMIYNANYLPDFVINGTNSIVNTMIYTLNFIVEKSTTPK